MSAARAKPQQRRAPAWHAAKSLCSLNIVFYPADSQQHPPISYSISQLLSHTIKAACPIIGSPPSTLSPFVRGRGGFALSRRATADNKSKWQAHSQRPPHTKGSCLMNHRHWQPRPPAHLPFSPHIPNANPGSIPRLHLQFIISWLFEVTLFTVGLSIITSCRCHGQTDEDPKHCIYSHWLSDRTTRPSVGVKVNRGSTTTGSPSIRGVKMEGFSLCTRAAERWQQSAGPDHFRQLISNAIGKGQHLHV